MCIRPSVFMRFAEGHRERWRADAVWRQHAFTIPTVNSVFTLPPSPAQQMLYQSGLTHPDCQSKSNPSIYFFFPPSALKTGSAITRCIGRVYDSRRLTQMVNDNNNLMDGYILLHAWDAANQTAPRSAVLRILQTSCLNYQQRAGDVSARLSVAVPVAPECVRELLSLYHKSVSTLTCALMI